VAEDAGEDPDRWLLIGPDTAGNLLEVVVLITAEGAQVVIRHADARQVREAARTMTEPTIHGHTESGRPITDQDVEILAAEGEAGYDVETLIARRNKRGRPTLGNAPATVESVRLDPQLRRLLLDRAEAEGTTTSELIREALRRYLRAA
jgi:Ribbon-helix-helix protein, copG family